MMLKQPTPKEKMKIPTFKELDVQRSKYKCNHLMGREVIDKVIVELAMGKITKDYCQNWDRCPDNGWGKCTPSMEAWMVNLRKPEYKNIFTAEELEIIQKVKTIG